MDEIAFNFKIYRDLEDRFIVVIQHVPLENFEENKKHWSAVLINLLRIICSEVEDLFKQIIRQPKRWVSDGVVPSDIAKLKERIDDPIKCRDVTIIDFKKVLNPRLKLSDLEISLSGLDELYRIPFEAFGEDDIPKWWKAYNNVNT